MGARCQPHPRSTNNLSRSAPLPTSDGVSSIKLMGGRGTAVPGAGSNNEHAGFRYGGTHINEGYISRRPVSTLNKVIKGDYYGINYLSK